MKAEVTDISPIDIDKANSFSLIPKTLQEAMQFSEMICNSSFCPKDFKGKSGDVLVAVQMGGEIGLQPMQAIQNIAVINGRPCVWGDALPALAKSHPHYESRDETFDDQNMTATCTIKRRGEQPQSVSFSQADAKLANLWGKAGPWTTYPKRMLAMRARAWAIRNVFPDALKGIQVAEEVQDIPIRDMGAADVVTNTDVKTVEPAQVLMYPEADFNKNLKTWLSYIESGNKTAEDIINMVESKGALTEGMKKKIKGE